MCSVLFARAPVLGLCFFVSVRGVVRRVCRLWCWSCRVFVCVSCGVNPTGFALVLGFVGFILKCDGARTLKCQVYSERDTPLKVPCAPKCIDFELPIIKTTKLLVETRSCTGAKRIYPWRFSSSCRAPFILNHDVSFITSLQ